MRWMSDLAETKLKSPDRNPSQLALYFVLAYGFSLVLWLPMLLGRSRSRFSLSIGTFGHTLAAVATHWIFTRNWRAVRIVVCFASSRRVSPVIARAQAGLKRSVR